MRFSIPIRLPSLSNARLGVREQIRTKKQHRQATLAALSGHRLPAPPLLVTLTRVGPRKLDDDNLQGAFKHVRDQIAAMVGLDDGSDQYTWVYRQRAGEYGVEVDLTPRLL